MEIRNINTYNTSHEKAFEALCNQLFERRVKKQYAVNHFAIVNGAGGDGGVETYASLDNGKFVGVQQGDQFKKIIGYAVKEELNRTFIANPYFDSLLIFFPLEIFTTHDQYKLC